VVVVVLAVMIITVAGAAGLAVNVFAHPSGV
jgi:hypothetical protein